MHCTGRPPVIDIVTLSNSIVNRPHLPAWVLLPPRLTVAMPYTYNETNGIFRQNFPQRRRLSLRA